MHPVSDQTCPPLRKLEREIKCPVCGGTMELRGHNFTPWWSCRSDDCAIGPADDEDGSKVRRLVYMPDPTEEHEDVQGWEIVWLCVKHGGEWGIGSRGSWVNASECLPNGDDDLGYKWRPTPPPETRREGLTLAQVFDAEPDGERCWAEHNAGPRKYIVHKAVLCVAPDEDVMLVEPAHVYSDMATGWTLVTRGGGE